MSKAVREAWDCMLLTGVVWAGLHDAVEKGYLETMTFGLCRDKDQTDLVEQFQYKFAYESDMVTMADSFGTDVAIPPLTVFSGAPNLCPHHPDSHHPDAFMAIMHRCKHRYNKCALSW